MAILQTSVKLGDFTTRSAIISRAARLDKKHHPVKFLTVKTISFRDGLTFKAALYSTYYSRINMNTLLLAHAPLYSIAQI
jgi:hypothetical protein